MSKIKPESPPNNSVDEQHQIRLLMHQASDQVLSNVVKQYNEKYYYWDEVKYRNKNYSLSEVSMWILLKLNRKIKARYLTISTILGYKFQYNYTDYIAKQLHRFDFNLGGDLDGSTTIPEGQGDRYMINALMEEAIASSQLEGAATTRKIAKEMLRSERAPKNLSEKMIVNNYLTIKEVKRYKTSKLTPELILNFHKTITNDTLEKEFNEGKFRENNEVNVVDSISGEVYYEPPSYTTIQRAIEDICKFANTEDENNFIHPILKAITLHFLIGYLHPFVDGNGRTARALFYWYLLSHGYWLIEYISISKTILGSPAGYGRAYICTEDDENDLTYFYNYNIKVLAESLNLFKRYIAKQMETKKKIYDLNKIESLNERQVEIIYRIQKAKHKMFTIKEVQNIFGIVYQTARLDLIGLESLGLLIQKRSGKKILFHRSDNLNNVLSDLRG